jgi:hypothetical protein
MSLLNRDTAFLLGLILVGAIWAFAHVALSLHALRAPQLPRVLRWLGWLPPLTPVAGFLCGARLWAWLWCIVGATYLVLRTLA